MEICSLPGYLDFAVPARTMQSDDIRIGKQGAMMKTKQQMRDVKLDATGRPSSLDSVLIAEDDPIFRHLLESWLQKWECKVTAVDNGMDAWNVLQQPNAPQMAILDWMMPAMDGVELCR